MQPKLKPLAICLCLLGVVAAPIYAATHSHGGISHRTRALENQVAALRKEVAELKHMHEHEHGHAHDVEVNPSHDTGSAHVCPGNQPSHQTNAALNSNIMAARSGTAQANQNLPTISGPQYLPQSGVQYLPIDLDVPGQSFVSTGPYIGVPLQFNGGDLIVNNPSVNQDVALLHLRKNIDQRLVALGLRPQDFHSHLLLSGMVEGQAMYRDLGGGPDSSDIDLTTAAIDAYILGPCTWTSALISLQYDNSIGAQEGSFSNNARSQNSRVVVTNGFIIVGDLAQWPFYLTIGQMYVPFGTYSTTLISSPLTKLIFRTQERAILLGYQQQATNSLYGAIYAFKGDSHVGATSRVNNGGINIGYKFEHKCFSGNFGAGYLVNIADTQGIQNNGLGAVYVPPAINVPPQTAVFGGFGALAGTGSEQIAHRVGGLDFRGLFSIGKTIDLLAEVITATNRFSAADMTMNGHNAKPAAIDLEAAYTFQSIQKPTSITLAYGASRDSLALGMPSRRYSVALNTSFWRNTLQSLEFRHDINFAASATSSGSGIPGPTASGKSDNIITGQFDIYF